MRNYGDDGGYSSHSTAKKRATKTCGRYRRIAPSVPLDRDERGAIFTEREPYLPPDIGCVAGNRGS
jgi:hypothetical protein